MCLEDYLRQNDIVVHRFRITTKAKGFCFRQGNYYVVIINDCFSTESQQCTILHEIIHVMENHFQKDSNDYENCEKEVNRLVKEMKTLYYTEFGYNYI